MTAQPDWIQEPIDSSHDRKRFDCGQSDLNTYLQRYAKQNHASGGARCFVAVNHADRSQIGGFYTLSPASVAFARTPALIQRGLGRYDLPVFRLGRLAVDLGAQGAGLGGRLLLAAGERSLRVADQVGGVALLIDAKDERAAAWYRGYGALSLVDTPLSLLLPLQTVAVALARGGGSPLEKATKPE